MAFCKFLDKKFGNVIFFLYICARKIYKYELNYTYEKKPSSCTHADDGIDNEPLGTELS